MSWINHLPPAYRSTFWKSIFKQQLGCRFDIIDSISLFIFLTYVIIYVLIHHIIFRLYLNFLNILYFFKYSCTNIFHRRSLYTFYLGLHVNVKNKSGLPYFVTIAIASWKFCCIALGEPWNDDGSTTILPGLCGCSSAWPCKWSIRPWYSILRPAWLHYMYSSLAPSVRTHESMMYCWNNLPL